MIDKVLIRTTVFPLLLVSIFGETVSHHTPDPHGTRGERWEQERRRQVEIANPLSSSFVKAKSSGGDDPPERDRSPSEETSFREERRFRRETRAGQADIANPNLG